MVGPDPTPEFVGELPPTRAALVYAHELHQGQRRQSDGAPFIAHPLELASLLVAAGARDEVVAAGVLHDTLEKTAADSAELSRRFGDHVATLVSAVSEDESIRSYGRRKAALRDRACRCVRRSFAAGWITRSAVCYCCGSGSRTRRWSRRSRRSCERCSRPRSSTSTLA